MDEKSFSKETVIEYLWQHSRFYGDKLYECEELFSEGRGYASLILLFANLEHISKSVVNDYNSSFKDIVNQINDKGILLPQEYKFINEGQYCIRRIRNLFAHKNLHAINLENIEKGKIIYYPLTEESSCLLLYDKISLIIFNFILKIVKEDFIEGVKQSLMTDMSKKIKECKLIFRIFTSNDLLNLKGFDKKSLDDLDIPEDAKIRILDNS